MHQTKKNDHSFAKCTAVHNKLSELLSKARGTHSKDSWHQEVAAQTHLLYQFIALLQLQGSVLQGGGGSVVDLQPLLIGRFTDIGHSEAQSTQSWRRIKNHHSLVFFAKKCILICRLILQLMLNFAFSSNFIYRPTLIHPKQSFLEICQTCLQNSSLLCASLQQQFWK